MVLWGTIVNAVAIIIGSLLGSVFRKIPEGIRSTVMQGISLAVIVLGLMMAFKSDNFLILIFSLVVGGIIGELIRLEHRLNQVGHWLEKLVGSKGHGNIATGFVTATLIYCVGAMSVLGAIDSGLRHDHTVLYTKSMLDGFSAIIFTSTFGMGVIFSAIPVFLYQGSIAIASTLITKVLSEVSLHAIINEVTGVGGVIIVGIGINLLELKKVNVANLLPALFIAAIAAVFVPDITSWIHSWMHG